MTRGARPRHWPAAKDREWMRRLALARVATWEAEIESGRRALTPQLAAALAADRALAAHLEAELREGEGPGPEKAPGAVVGV